MTRVELYLALVSCILIARMFVGAGIAQWRAWRSLRRHLDRIAELGPDDGLRGPWS